MISWSFCFTRAHTLAFPFPPEPTYEHNFDPERDVSVTISPSGAICCFPFSVRPCPVSFLSNQLWSRWLDCLAEVLLAVMNTGLLWACDVWVFVWWGRGWQVVGSFGFHSPSLFSSRPHASSLCNDLMLLIDLLFFVLLNGLIYSFVILHLNDILYSAYGCSSVGKMQL